LPGINLKARRAKRRAFFFGDGAPESPAEAAAQGTVTLTQLEGLLRLPAASWTAMAK
jgi:hypothetical protein